MSDALIGPDGLVSLPISPNLRYPFANGATIHLAEPMVEGLVKEELSWSLDLGQLVTGVGFTVREVA
jgi:hypothetical protein